MCGDALVGVSYPFFKTANPQSHTRLSCLASLIWILLNMASLICPCRSPQPPPAPFSLCLNLLQGPTEALPSRLRRALPIAPPTLLILAPARTAELHTVPLHPPLPPSAAKGGFQTVLVWGRKASLEGRGELRWRVERRRPQCGAEQLLPRCLAQGVWVEVSGLWHLVWCQWEQAGMAAFLLADVAGLVYNIFNSPRTTKWQLSAAFFKFSFYLKYGGMFFVSKGA